MTRRADLILWIRGDAVLWRLVGEEIIALDLRTSKYLHINASGALLWQRLQTATPYDELAGTLVDAFGLERDHAERDVEAFVAMLSDKGLLDQ
jgi:hypothetical protein